MKKYFLIIGLVILVCGCSKKETKLDTILKENNYIIIDVRTKDEYDGGHLDNAINIPLNEIKYANLDKEKDILVYCKSGFRSKEAYSILKEIGYHVYDLGAYNKINLS